MDIREGMHRVSVVAGIVGGIVGGYLGYSEAQPAWDAYRDHRRFETAVATPVMQEVIKAVRGYTGQQTDLAYANGVVAAAPDSVTPKDPNAPTDWSKAVWKFPPEDQHYGDKIVSVNTDGISDVLLDPAGAIVSIGFLDRDPVRRSEYPAFPFAAFLYPILGFLVPWGAIRTTTWIGEGFFRPRI